MHPPPYYAVHPHAMVHHHHHHHLMQVSSLEDDELFEQKLHQYEDIIENVVEKNGNGNCRLIFLPSSPSSTSTRTFLPRTPR